MEGYRDFSTAETELAGWVEDRSWTTGEGPKTLFDGAFPARAGGRELRRLRDPDVEDTGDDHTGS